jgi:acyl carrier protein
MEKHLDKIISIAKNDLNLIIQDALPTDTLSTHRIDSLEYMSLIVYIENHYDIEIEFSDAMLNDFSLITFQDLINEMERALIKKDV